MRKTFRTLKKDVVTPFCSASVLSTQVI